MSILQVKDIKFVIYRVSFEQSDVDILIRQYETFGNRLLLSSSAWMIILSPSNPAYVLQVSQIYMLVRPSYLKFSMFKI